MAVLYHSRKGKWIVECVVSKEVCGCVPQNARKVAKYDFANVAKYDFYKVDKYNFELQSEVCVKGVISFKDAQIF